MTGHSTATGPGPSAPARDDAHAPAAGDAPGVAGPDLGEVPGLGDGPDLRDLKPGEVVAVRGPNSLPWLAAYRAVLAAGAVPLLLDADVPDAEARRWLARAGGGRLLGAAPAPPWVELTRAAAPPAGIPGTVQLCSSGTTGAPKLVTRTVASLRAEGQRHVRFADLAAPDHVVVPLPMWHAYALGWVHACLEVGCRLDPLRPNQLGRLTQLLEEGATVVPLVPTTAALLAARGGRAVRRDHRLRLAMVGAGAVRDDLDRAFRAAFGLGLARDYGSTETGSLFSAHPGVPPGCVGTPLPGVRFRVVDEQGLAVPPGESGRLEVQVDGATRWWDTGDQVRWRPPDGLFILGRRTRAVRRGDRWASPDEIEEVLRGHPDVLDVRVLAVSRPGRPTPALHARVVNLRGVHADLAPIRRHAADHLAAHKVPDRVVSVGELARGPSGKVRAEPRLQLAGAADLVAAAQAYKRSELLFALVRLGVLRALATEPADAPTVAGRLGLDPHACAQLLRAAQDAGLLCPAPASDQAPEGPDPDPDRRAATNPAADLAGALPGIELEQRLSRSWVTREELADVGRHGVAARSFERTGPDPDLRQAYAAAMHSPAAKHRCRLGLALAGFREGSLLEITCGPGRYLDRSGTTRGHLVRVGVLAGNDLDPRAGELPPDQTFDLVVVCNAIHLAGPGADLPRLAAALAPGGRLLIDDVFLDAPQGLPGDVRLDWLTHGGVSWPTEAATVAGLAAAGLAVVRIVHVGQPAVTLLLATGPGGDG